MHQKIEGQNQAKNQAIRMLEESEKKRAELRFKKGLEVLEKGNVSILKNREFTEKLAPYLFQNFSHKPEDTSAVIIDGLFSLLEKSDIEDVVQGIIEQLCTSAQSASKIHLVKALSKRVILLLEKNSFALFHSATICDFLFNSSVLLVRSSQWDAFEKALSVLWVKRNISFDSSDRSPSQIEQILSKIGSNEVIEKILQYHNCGDKERKESARRCIKYLGNRAVTYLINRLVYSVTKDERFLLMEIIGGFGSTSIQTIKEFLDKEMPWYAVRNLIILVAEIGSDENYSLVEGFILHPDIRVQQQVVSCVVKLKGRNLEKRLIQALSVVHDEIKMKLVMQLGEYEGEDIANGLVDLLHHRSSFTESIRDELLYRILISLRSFSYPNVLNLVKHLHQECIEDKGGRDRLTIAAKETIQILAPKVRHRQKGGKNFSDTPSYDIDSKKNEKSREGITQYLDELSELLKVGDREKASSFVFEKCVQSAKVKDFQTAELLRDKFLDIDPNALQEVIQLSEIIEEEKNTPWSGHHIEIWEELYEKMTTESFDFFFSSLINETYQPEETIIDVGEIDSSLYFINSGSVRLSCKCGEQETFLKRLRAGDIAGISTFFSSTVWTVKLTALQKTELHVLRRNDFQKIITKYPDIEKVLQEFCEKKEDISNLVKMSGKERRNFARYSVNVTVNNVLLDPYGSSSGRRIFQGEMIDISRGGLAFSVKITKKENAHLLLGRQIISEINLRGSEVLKGFGFITGVRYRYEIMKEFSVHVKFYKEIEQYQVTDVLNLVI